MKLPALIIGDLHITHLNLDVFARFTDQINALKESFATLIVVGDLFDSQESTRWHAIVAVHDFLYTLHSQNIDIYLLSGTHDVLYLRRGRSTLEAFRGIARVITERYVDETGVWVPHSFDLEEDIKFLLENQNLDRLCFSHHMIRGLNINNFVIPHGIPKEVLSRYRMCFNGHIHQPQVDANIINVGSPWQHSFAEADQTKYLWLLTSDFHITPIPSSIPPRYKIISAHDLLSAPQPGLAGCSVRVIVEDQNLTELTSALEKAGALRWEFQFVQKQVSNVIQHEEQKYTVHLMDAWRTWALHRDLSIDHCELGEFILGSVEKG